MMIRQVFVLGLVLSAPVGLARAEDPAAVFKAQCAKCHGDAGQSDTSVAKAMKVPPIAGDAELAGKSTAEIATIIKENKKHAAIVGKLTPEQIEAAAEQAKKLAGGQ
jgi:mono/diheme cytochrome c family protein